jgi:hypothetical protein
MIPSVIDHYTPGYLTGALEREAALGPHRQGTAQGVEAEERIRPWDKVNAGDGRLRDKIPVHRVTEALIEARAVQVDREPDGAPKQRRG